MKKISKNKLAAIIYANFITGLFFPFQPILWHFRKQIAKNAYKVIIG